MILPIQNYNFYNYRNSNVSFGATQNVQGQKPAMRPDLTSFPTNNIEKRMSAYPQYVQALKSEDNTYYQLTINILSKLKQEHLDKFSDEELKDQVGWIYNSNKQLSRKGIKYDCPTSTLNVIRAINQLSPKMFDAIGKNALLSSLHNDNDSIDRIQNIAASRISLMPELFTEESISQLDSFDVFPWVRGTQYEGDCYLPFGFYSQLKPKYMNNNPLLYSVIDSVYKNNL